MRGQAKANTNIALIKYWGKRQKELNLPVTDSLSVTLDGLSTSVEAVFDKAAVHDSLRINGAIVEGAALQRLTQWLDGFRQAHQVKEFCLVNTQSNIPISAGLASSASSYAAIAGACLRAVAGDVSSENISRWARRGSGSASRSVFGGLVVWQAGEAADGSDSYATPLGAGEGIVVVAAVVSDKPKSISSREGMNRTVETSPLYPGWATTVSRDMAAARAAIKAGDLKLLFEVAEHNAFAMHATALAARPAVRYLQAGSFAIIDEVKRLRSEGALAYVTMDAGPNVKVLTTSDYADVVMERLTPISKKLFRCGVGEGLT